MARSTELDDDSLMLEFSGSLFDEDFNDPGVERSSRSVNGDAPEPSSTGLIQAVKIVLASG